MNNILLNKNKYTSISFGYNNNHSEQQYRLFTSKCNLKYKRYTNSLVKFISIFNTFVTEKLPNNKQDFIINIKDQATKNNFSATENIYDLNSKINKLETRINNLLSQKGLKHYPNFIAFTMQGTNFTRRANLLNYQKTYVNNIQPNYLYNKNNLWFLKLFSQQIKFKFNLNHLYNYVKIYNWNINFNATGNVNTSATITLSI